MNTVSRFIALFFSFSVIFSAVTAFAPLSTRPTTTTTTTRVVSLLDATSIDNGNVNVNGDNINSFDTYQQVDSQPLAYQVTAEGTGDGVAEEGQLVTVAYKGRFVFSDRQFDKGSGFVFRIGGGKVLKGWDQGIVGMRVGDKRTLRIPPSLAYGDDWYKGTIPPKSHLEFDVELLNIAKPEEEFKVKLEAFGIGRALGFVALTGLMAIAPLIS
eukprot:CAMPEP_0198141736 /NCGR_PEP_ID=MMETSP1443-20131203/4679_1 /TAXON_ID=186043 /ORGANISM="Entomoneis sp., Strain CCMP2396" /LENGTH=212 /DNA_ID=CAMNT_0043804563 /DNA_START=178 /DNA_END=816 /DNA_ORIENTATION=+